MYEVSVVVPVYNAEKYLVETLSCIVNQTMRDIEIICVDDASEDNSFSILERFAKDDRRIKIIHNSTNCGAGVSRNIGLKEASGSYICFLDADDFYSEQLIEKEYDAISRNAADIAIVPSIKDNDGNEKSQLCWEEQCVAMPFMEQLTPKQVVVPWDKMYRRQFINEHGLQYQNIKSSNDIFFGFMSVLLAQKIVLVGNSSPLVVHRLVTTENQISLKRTSMNAYRALEQIHISMVEKGLWEKDYEVFFEFFAGHIKSEYRRCKNEQINQQTYAYIAQEGMKRIGFLELSSAQFKNQQLYQQLCNFSRYSYNSAWFRTYEEFLKWNEHIIVSRLRYYNQNAKKIAVWGAGYRAEKFLEFCKNGSYEINYVIDKDAHKQGRMFHEMIIRKFDEIFEQVDVVIVLRTDFYKEICMEVERADRYIEVWNMEEECLLSK